MGKIYAEYANVPFVNLSSVTIPEDVYRVVPDKYAKFHKLIPFSRGADGVKVAMENPTDKVTIAALEKKTGQKIVVYYATEKTCATRYSFINEMFKKYMRIL